jgi:hypothetical protein
VLGRDGADRAMASLAESDALGWIASAQKDALLHDASPTDDVLGAHQRRLAATCMAMGGPAHRPAARMRSAYAGLEVRNKVGTSHRKG